MSLINEALKRTRDGSYRHGPLPAAAPAAYRVAPPPPPPPLAVARRRLALAGLLIVATVAGFAAHQFFPRPATPSAPTMDVQTAEAELVKQLLTQPPATPPPAHLLPPDATATAPAVADVPAPAGVELVAPPPRALPALSLQGILRGGKVAEAMINGYTYRVGDTVGGARLVAIEDSAVRLELDGREFTLRMR
jgi:hypothetical protein